MRRCSSTSPTRPPASRSTSDHPELVEDLEGAFERIVEDAWSWRHDDEDGPNGPSHGRASVVGPQVLVPLQDGSLELGTYQGIFFCEFDGPRERKIYVTSLH